MTPDLAAKLALDLSNILHVIDVPVCQQQQFRMDIERADPIAGTIRCVEQNPSARRFEQVAIGLENPTAKCFRLRHVESLNRQWLHWIQFSTIKQQSAGSRFNDSTI